jgi:hypothetical protein
MLLLHAYNKKYWLAYSHFKSLWSCPSLSKSSSSSSSAALRTAAITTVPSSAGLSLFDLTNPLQDDHDKSNNNNNNSKPRDSSSVASPAAVDTEIIMSERESSSENSRFKMYDYSQWTEEELMADIESKLRFLRTSLDVC